MKSFLHRTTLLTLLLLCIFVGSTLYSASGKMSDVISADNLPSSQVNPVAPIVLTDFSAVGFASSSLPVILTVAVPLNNLDLLQSMEATISNPFSSQYRHFLSQQTVEQMFLPVSQYQSVLSYLTNAGFTIDSTAEDSIIIASGTAGLLQTSLGLSTTVYSNGTASYYSASGSPTLPGIYAYSSNVTGLLIKSPTIQAQTKAIALDSQGIPNVTSSSVSFEAKSLLSAYNASGLVSSGYDGKGKTIGIYEVTGDPYITQELAVFDQEEGLPPPPGFNIVPVGPNNPNIGVTYFGIPGEEALDVEVSHSMAPGANITIYSSNDAIPEAPVIALVDQQNSVNVFTESYSWEEDDYSFLGPSFFAFNAYLSDQYFMLGSAEGISFMVSSGDGGGSGYSAQPYGSLDTYADSPYVTAMGGTTTYLDYNGSGVASTYQTAWSTGFTNPTNSGGSTGGPSEVYPRPWYQQNITVPKSYPNGRMEPDISLEANVLPGVIEVNDNRVVSSSAGYFVFLDGGTSESSPLYAGLLIDIDSRIDGSLGLVNPSLYQMASTPSLYAKEFIPITYGFTTPWTASYGYNLATGLGAPNIGNMAAYYASHSSGSVSNINVTVSNEKGKAKFEFLDGQIIYISASVSRIAPHALTAELVTLAGTVAKVPLSLDKSAGEWTGTITVPAGANGISYVNVNGTLGGSQVIGFVEIFTGYLATFNSPVALPGAFGWSSLFGIDISVAITNLNGSSVTNGSYGYSVSSYSILDNTYTQYLTRNLKFKNGSWENELTGNYPVGASVIVLNGGAYGFDSFQNGDDLTYSSVYPPVDNFPAVASPSQYLEITGRVVAPGNTPNIISSETGLPLAETIALGSNVTAYLISPAGKVISSADIGGVSVPITSSFPGNYLGFLQVPANAAPGLYTIMFNATYSSIDLNGLDIVGSYFTQLAIANQAAIIPHIALTPSTVGEGQMLTIKANIAYANGTEVKYGVYSATLYPAFDSNNYAYYSSLTAGEVPLYYNAALNLWVGNVTIPSSSNLGWIGGITPYYSLIFSPFPILNTNGIVTQPVNGQWDAYVSGISADGVPTTSDESAQVPFTVSATPVSATISGLHSSTLSGAAQDKLSFEDASKIMSPYSLAGIVSVAAVVAGAGAVSIRRKKNQKGIGSP